MARKALVVGINHYPKYQNDRGDPRHLEYPSKDAEAIAQLLRQCGHFEVEMLPVKEDNGSLVVHEKGLIKAAYFKGKIFDLLQAKDGQTTALLFFAGHGLVDNRYGNEIGYLGTSDLNPQDDRWGVPFDFLADQMGKSNIPEQIIWLDCCYSGQLTESLFQKFNNLAHKSNVNRSFIAACRQSEKAHGVDGHGILTHLLLEVLKPERYSVGYNINNIDVERGVEAEFQKHPKFSTYPQRPVYFHNGRPIDFWVGTSTIQTKSYAETKTDQTTVNVNIDNRSGGVYFGLIVAVISAIISIISFGVTDPTIRQFFSLEKKRGSYAQNTTVVTPTPIYTQSLIPSPPVYVPPSPMPYTDIKSEVGAEALLVELKQLLKQGNFKAAEEKTSKIMLYVANREKEGTIDSESMANFSCTDLRTIDQLWVNNSNGRFGFSVQKRILEENGKDWDKFWNAIGWRSGAKWKSYSDLTFAKNAKKGHLPAYPYSGGWWFVRENDDGRGVSSFESMLVRCRI